VAQYISDNTVNIAAAEAGGGQADLLCQLVEGIGKHAVDERDDELAKLRENLEAQAKCLRGTTDLVQMRNAVEAVIDVMARHNDGVMSDYRVRSSELAKALRMMVDTIGHVSKSSQAAVHQLSVIQKNLEEATAAQDTTKLRSKLGVCLNLIKEHSESLRTQSEERIVHLKSFIAESPSATQAASMFDEPLDPVTGLPTRSFAEKMIEERLARKTDCMVGVVTVDRFNGLRTRFGQHIIDDLAKTVAQHLAQRLPEATTLCRWSANSFVALTDIVTSYAEMSQQWRKVRGLRVEKQIEDPSTTALVVLNTSLMVEHLGPTSSKREVIQSIDRYVTQHA
jgi:GGDEF domain-containing protein